MKILLFKKSMALMLGIAFILNHFSILVAATGAQSMTEEDIVLLAPVEDMLVETDNGVNEEYEKALEIEKDEKELFEERPTLFGIGNEDGVNGGSATASTWPLHEIDSPVGADNGNAVIEFDVVPNVTKEIYIDTISDITKLAVNSSVVKQITVTPATAEVNVSLDENTIGSVAYSEESGKLTVTGLSSGNAVITVTASAEGYTSVEETLSVKVVEPGGSQNSDVFIGNLYDLWFLTPGESRNIVVATNPEDATVTAASDSDVVALASVSDGNILCVTANEEGTTFVTVTASVDGEESAKRITVQVLPKAYHGSERNPVSINSGWSFWYGGTSTINLADISQPTYTIPGGWESIKLPHSWNAKEGYVMVADYPENPGSSVIKYRRGNGYYRKVVNFDSTAYSGKRIYLQFGAANMYADVYLNGEQLGMHYGGYSKFGFDITDKVVLGFDNIIAVRVNNANPGIMPLSGDFNIQGGLYRDVEVIAVDPLHIDMDDYASPGVYLTQTNVSDSSAMLAVRSKIVNSSAEAKTAYIKATVSERDGSAVVATLDTTQTIAAGYFYEFNETANISSPHLWDGLKDPYQYIVTVEVREGSNGEGRLADSVRERIGFRFYEVDEDSGFFLNGEHYRLAGVNKHQDVMDMGPAVTGKEMDIDMSYILDIGANTVRVAHYQHDRHTYDLCDEMGIVVWAEIPLVNGTRDTDLFKKNVETQLKELVRQNYNNTSILFWGLHNEQWPESSSTVNPIPLLEATYKLYKEEDPTRLVTLATAQTHLQPLSWWADVTTWNKYFGWYDANIYNFEKYMQNIKNWTQTNATVTDPSSGLMSAVNGKIGMGEYGAGMNPYNYTNYETTRPNGLLNVPGGVTGKLHPQDFGNLAHEVEWKAISSFDWMWGTYIWNMFDFASTRKQEGGMYWGVNDKGLMTYDRSVKKDTYYFYRSVWSDSPTLYIASQRYTDRSGLAREEQTTLVKVYSNMDEVTLYLNGNNMGTITSEEAKNDYQYGVFRWKDVELEEGNNTVEVIGIKDGKTYKDYCEWNLSIIVDPNAPISRFKAASSSTVQTSGDYAAANAFDGNPTTRWSSGSNAIDYPQWLKVDLGKSYNISEYFIKWVNAEVGSSRGYLYNIWVSETDDWVSNSNPGSYTKVVDRTNNTEKGEVSDTVEQDKGYTARYIVLDITGKFDGNSYSVATLWMFDIFGWTLNSSTLTVNEQDKKIHAEYGDTVAELKGKLFVDGNGSVSIVNAAGITAGENEPIHGGMKVMVSSIVDGSSHHILYDLIFSGEIASDGYAVDYGTRTVSGVPAGVNASEFLNNFTYNEQDFRLELYDESGIVAGINRGNVTGGDVAVTGSLTLKVVHMVGESRVEEEYSISVAGYDFIAVTGIMLKEAIATLGTDLTLCGTVTPDGATYKTIVWSVANAGTTGAIIVDGSTLRTTASGMAVVTATIIGGGAEGADYTQSFNMLVQPTSGGQEDKTLVAVEGISIQTKEYDGTTDATIEGMPRWHLLSTSTSGSALKLSDELDADLTIGGAGTAVFLDAETGSGKPVFITGFYLEGADAEYYELDFSGITGCITPKALTLSVTSATKKHDGTANLSTYHLDSYALEGLIGFDDVDLDTVTGAFAQSVAGITTASITSVTLKGVKQGNYTISQSLPIDIPATIQGKNIRSVALITDITVAYGTAASSLSLPADVQAILDDNTNTGLSIVWDTGNYNGNTAGRYTLQGVLTLPGDGSLTNTKALKAFISVTVNEAPSIAKDIKSVASLTGISVAYATAESSLKLPATVRVTLDDDTTATLLVTWNKSNYNSNRIGTYTSQGTLVLPEDGTISNKANLVAAITITVRAGSSGDNDNSNSSKGSGNNNGDTGNGGASSLSQLSLTVSGGMDIVKSEMVEALVSEAITNRQMVVVELSAGQNAAELSKEALTAVAESRAGVIVQKEIVTVTVPNSAVNEILQKETGTMVVRFGPVGESKANVLMVEMPENALKFFANVTVETDGKAVDKVYEGVKISIDLSSLILAEKDIENLTGFVVGEEGSISLMGGVYNPDAQTFELQTTRLGQIGVMVNENLISVNFVLGQSSYTVNREAKNMDSAPMIVDSRTMLPLRTIAESFGAELAWDDATKTVTIELDGKKVRLTIGQLEEGMDVPAQIINGRTMVPIRYISETLGSNVVWDEENKSISIFR